jgi:hypothetical protein
MNPAFGPFQSPWAKHCLLGACVIVLAAVSAIPFMPWPFSGSEPADRPASIRHRDDETAHRAWFDLNARIQSLKLALSNLSDASREGSRAAFTEETSARSAFEDWIKQRPGASGASIANDSAVQQMRERFKQARVRYLVARSRVSEIPAAIAECDKLRLDIARRIFNGTVDETELKKLRDAASDLDEHFKGSSNAQQARINAQAEQEVADFIAFHTKGRP